MATSWPQEAAWPTDLREHAAYLGKYLRDALLSIEREKDRPVPPELAKIMIMGSLSLLVKLQNMPDFRTVHDALNLARTEATASAASTTESLNRIDAGLKQITGVIQQTMRDNTDAARDAKIAAKEAAEASKTAVGMVRELRSAGQNGQVAMPSTYAAIAARGILPSSIHNMQSHRATPAQALREIIVNIRNPLTVANIRAMNPRNLKAHVDRAIEQSGNEHIKHIRVASTNQLKSGDLSIKTATTEDMEALRQFAEDWEHRLGTNAAVRIPTYGILAHGIRTSSINMNDFEYNRDEILQENKPFIPNASIKYIGWLTRTSPTKSASSAIIEFTRPEDANKIIDEGLIWQGEVFQCERYDRQCRLKQCYQCHKYGHIGTQCKATIKCGCCAQDHATRECPNKANKDMRKCATCHGDHEAWSNHCPDRKEEMNRIKADISQDQGFTRSQQAQPLDGHPNHRPRESALPPETDRLWTHRDNQRLGGASRRPREPRRESTLGTSRQRVKTKKTQSRST
uniref:CCHC-type domain-containing protein n=1 Tax=Bionectria ochroleuca TaxID=29856 RepID=A0A8H7NA94_BIOOC